MNYQYDKRQSALLKNSAMTDSNQRIAQQQAQLDRLHGRQGHGFAAEQGNDLYDRIMGKNAAIVGNDNAKNRADRQVDGTLYQTKYCQTGKASVDAAFKTSSGLGEYRYMNPDGTPMKLEVPADQYEEAVAQMEMRIRQGRVPGVDDPAMAEKLIHKGALTYLQSCNLAKAGTIESILYDSVTGAVVASSAFGISAALVYAQSIWSGQDQANALENALWAGCQGGGTAFLTALVTNQLMRSSLMESARSLAEKIEAKLGKKLSDTITQSASGSSKIIRGTLVSSAVTLAVLSAEDVKNVCQGKISGKQLFQNVTVKASGLAGGYGASQGAKYLLTKAISGVLPGISFVVQVGAAAAGAAASTSLTQTITGKFMESDAEEMSKILEKQLLILSNEYLLTPEELDLVVGDLAVQCAGETLLDMFRAANRDRFAYDMEEKIIKRIISWRAPVSLPSGQQAADALGRMSQPKAPSSRPKGQDMIDLAQTITGRTMTENAAAHGFYAARQTNQLLKQEQELARQLRPNQEWEKEKQEIYKQIDELLDF